MDGISAVLWPRHEVLQLVLPELICPMGLSSMAATEVIRQIAQLARLDDESSGHVSFETWLGVSRKVVGWSDYSSMLFWELLNVAVSYVSKLPSEYASGATNYSSVELEYVAIFLIMYVSEPGSKSPSPSSAQSPFVETIWPSQSVELDQFISSSPLSPRNGSSSSSSSSSNSSGSGGGLGVATGSGRRSDSRQGFVGNMSSGSSPKSPHSPSRSSSSSSGSALSPSRKNVWGHSRNGHYLQAVRSKIPIILSALSAEESVVDEASSGTSSNGSISTLNLTLKTDFSVSRRTIDSLRLIVGGGLDWENEVVDISTLHSSSKSSSMHPSIASGSAFQSTISFNDVSNWFNLHMAINEHYYPKPASAVASPASHSSSSSGSLLSPTGSRSSTALMGGGGSGASSTATRGGDELAEGEFLSSHLNRSTPIRTVIPLMTINRLNPAVCSSLSNTTHIVLASTSTALSNEGLTSDVTHSTESASSLSAMESETNHDDITSQIRKLEVSSSRHDGSANDLLDLVELGNLKSSASSNFEFYSNEIRQSVDGSFNSDIDMNESFGDSGIRGVSKVSRRNAAARISDISRLPVGLVGDSSNCSLYLLSPFSSVYISNCQDVTVILGAVGGAVICSNCQRVKISVVCRKLILQDCQDCTINIACLAPSMVSADCQHISFGPYNVAYRHMKAHITFAGLDILCKDKSDSLSSSTSTSSASASDFNMWRSFCGDVGGNSLTREAGYDSSSNASQARYTYPLVTNDALANIQPASQFQTAIVPYKSEFIPFRKGAIDLPVEYSESLARRADTLSQLHARFHGIVDSKLSASTPNSHQSDLVSSGGTSAEAAIQFSSTHISPVVKKQFLNWLKSSGKLREVVDAIKIDAADAEAKKANSSSSSSGNNYNNNSNNSSSNSNSNSSSNGGGGGSSNGFAAAGRPSRRII